MNLKQVLGKNKRNLEAELNITAVMNIFVILIPFLLLTATFVRIAIIELSLPSLEVKESTNLEELKDLTLLMVTIKPEGFEIKTSENNFPRIPKKASGFDYDKLSEQLKTIKKREFYSQSISISGLSVTAAGAEFFTNLVVGVC